MDFYNILLAALLVVILMGVIKGCGENRSIIVFRDYDDLGLTFAVPASFYFITLIITRMGGSEKFSLVIGGAVSLWLFTIVMKNTYLDNDRNVGKFLLAMITKTPLAIIWILNLIKLLNPDGKGAQRTRNRSEALLILTFLTPVIGLLVVEKTGSYFNPKSWIHGRRVGSKIRNNL